MRVHFTAKDMTTMTLSQLMFAKGYCGTRPNNSAALIFTQNVEHTDCEKCIAKLEKVGKR